MRDNNCGKLNNPRSDFQTSFKVTFLELEVDPNDVTVEIIGPELNTIPCNLNLKSNGGTCTFVPLIIGMYKVCVCFSPMHIDTVDGSYNSCVYRRLLYSMATR